MNTPNLVSFEARPNDTEEKRDTLQSYKKLMEFLNQTFAPLVRNMFGSDIRLENHIYQPTNSRDGSLAFVSREIQDNTLKVYWNETAIESLLSYETDMNTRMDLIKIITHEFAHVKEGNKWGSHEKGEHSASFEYLQREILTALLREKP